MQTLPPANELYTAMKNRDSTYVGIFIVGVKTTGIFCRPGCTARLPLLKNIEFFSNSIQAMHAGYRACKRCKPLSNGQSIHSTIQPVLKKLESSNNRIRNQELAKWGFDPSTVRRQFQRQFGMTFQAYQRALRMGQALKHVREGQKIIKTQQKAGFESGSGFREAFNKYFGIAPKLAKSVEAKCLFAKWTDTPLGALLILVNDDGIYLCDFVDRRGLEREMQKIAKRFQILPESHPLLSLASQQLNDYFAGRRRQFDLPLANRGTEFQRKVWDQLLAIPIGETRSYADIARLIGAVGKQSARAVARANGDNFRSLIIPCHRVIGSDGALTGYGGGLARKQWLLDFERNSFSPSNSLN